MNAVARNRLKLLLLALVFFAPLIGAALITYVMPEWIPSGRVNYGSLIEPPRPLPLLTLTDASGAAAPDALRGRWSLVYLAGAQCDETCQGQLLLTRQVRLALGKDRMRVQRVYLAPDEVALAAARAALSVAHPDLAFLVDAGTPGAADFFQPTDAHALYLVDPLGNWLMVYTGEVQAKGLHKDLKKLLRFSQIG